MADKKKDDKDIQIEARLTVTSSSGLATTVRRFDHAWIQMQELAKQGLPVSIRLDGFVRKDSAKDEFVIRY